MTSWREVVGKAIDAIGAFWNSGTKQIELPPPVEVHRPAPRPARKLRDMLKKHDGMHE